jgi:hypothetical protein
VDDRQVIEQTGKVKRVPLLRQNRELREIGVWNWTIPALGARLDDGRTILTCPQAGACASLCYARNGTFLFRNVKSAHARNLKRVLDDLSNWKDEMIAEATKRARGGYVRIHDAGDFFSDEYLQTWLDIAAAVPTTTFYAYTKEVSRFKRLVEGKAPSNFKWLYSMGGKEDHLIDTANDRHAEVFPDAESLAAAGYFNQEESDVLAIEAPTNRIGIVANNIRHFRKRQGAATFGGLQKDRE